MFARTPQFGLFRGAVSDAVGTAELVIPQAGPSHGASLRGIEQGEEGRVRTVATTTIDALVAERGLDRVDFIKCDAEGHEHAIFRGASGVLARDLPGVLVECDRGFVAGDPVGELWAMFEALGYEGWVIFKDRLVPIGEFRYEIHQSPDRKKHDHGHNFLFVHPARGL